MCKHHPSTAGNGTSYHGNQLRYIRVLSHIITVFIKRVSFLFHAATHSGSRDTVTLSEKTQIRCITRGDRDTAHVEVMVYKLSSMNTKQPLEVFPDALTVTVVERDNGKKHDSEKFVN